MYRNGILQEVKHETGDQRMGRQAGAVRGTERGTGGGLCQWDRELTRTAGGAGVLLRASESAV